MASRQGQPSAKILLYLCFGIGNWWYRLRNIKPIPNITFIQTIYSNHIYNFSLLWSKKISVPDLNLVYLLQEK